MPISRRASRSARPRSGTMSRPPNRICPALGSTRRLMQRSSVLLPVPDAPITAVRPLPLTSSVNPFSTGWPGV